MNPISKDLNVLVDKFGSGGPTFSLGMSKRFGTKTMVTVRHNGTPVNFDGGNVGENLVNALKFALGVGMTVLEKVLVYNVLS